MTDPTWPPPDPQPPHQPPPHQPPHQAAPPPPPPPLPWTQPQYAVPPPQADRSQSPRAIVYGLGIGMAIYLLAYIATAAFTFAQPSRGERGYVALAASFVSGGIATGVVLLASIVLMVIRRTRILGAGMVISIALGILCGGGVCTALVVGTAG
jgi:U5 snRNP spliceosome subunit